MGFQSEFRRPTEKEKRLIERLLEADFPGRDELARQVTHCSVRQVDEEGSLEFDFQVDSNLAPVLKRVPIEAEGTDEDGIRVHVLFHVVDGRARELEIYKDDGSAIRRMPEPREFELLVLPPEKRITIPSRKT